MWLPQSLLSVFSSGLVETQPSSLLTLSSKSSLCFPEPLGLYPGSQEPLLAQPTLVLPLQLNF